MKSYSNESNRRAENAGIKMARDAKKYAMREFGIEIFTQGKGDDVFLTAGCLTPFSEPSLSNQLENAAMFQSYFTSGSILHHFIEDEIAPKALANYLKSVFLNKPINYLTLTPNTTICMDCGHKMLGKDALHIETCPKCNTDNLATTSRVIGYVKIIAKKKIRVENGMYMGDSVFWSAARRIDHVEKKRVTNEVLTEAINKL